MLGTTTGGSLTNAAGQDFKATVAVSSATSNAVLMRVGTDNQTTGTARPTAGLYWEANAGNGPNWEYCIENTTCTSSGVAIAANTFVRLEIYVVATGAGTSTVNYYINGSKFTYSSATVDTSTLQSPAINCWDNNSSSTDCYVDYYQIRGDTSAMR